MHFIWEAVGTDFQTEAVVPTPDDEEKIPHGQPGPLHGSSSPLSPSEPARVVRHNKASI